MLSTICTVTLLLLYKPFHIDISFLFLDGYHKAKVNQTRMIKMYMENQKFRKAETHLPFYIPFATIPLVNCMFTLHEDILPQYSMLTLHEDILHQCSKFALYEDILHQCMFVLYEDMRLYYIKYVYPA